MLTYTHLFNISDMSLPYHLHKIESDTTSVSVNLNGKLLGYYKPNKGTTYQFTKYLDLDNNIFDLLISGSLQTYSVKIDKTLFNDLTVTYIRLDDGRFLYKDNETNLYSWSTTLRSRFYFNPYYFDSKFLWELRMNYVPTGIQVTNQWPPNLERDIFLNTVVSFDNSFGWTGEQSITEVSPMTIDFFNNDVTGYTVPFELSEIIELPDLYDGDVLTISNGKENINVTVSNCIPTQFTYDSYTETDRPIVHVPIQITNPNELVHYAKGLEREIEEVINLNLYNNDIQFTIKRT